MESKTDNRSLVLVVDDEPELREILREEFEYFGYDVLEAVNGTRALEIIEANPIDVVVSDIRMPGGSGTDLLSNILSRKGWQPPVILVSAFADANTQDQGIIGAFAYLSKPYDLEVLMKHTAEAIAWGRSKR